MYLEKKNFMKKITTILTLLLILNSYSFAQYFQGGFYNVGNKVVFKMKPTGNITTDISYMEVAFRFNTASTPAFTVTPPVNILPNAKFVPFNSDYEAGGYTYKKFFHSGSVIPITTYTAGTEYELFSVTLNGPTAVADIELASDFFGSGFAPNFAFGVVDGNTNIIDPNGADELYGTGFFKVGSQNFVPLTNVPVPVKFLGFDVAKKNNAAVLSWTVENESAITDKYIIESSANSVDFTTVVGTVAALNNGRTSNTYSFTQDNISAVRSSGVVYYRIKQIDKDGKFVYTPIRNLRLDGKGFAVNAYPNPVKSSTKLTIDLVNDSRVLVSITDATGKQVKSLQLQGFKGPNIKEVNLSSLASGNYLLKVQAGSEIKSVPLIKAN